jgi:hypothetical protein
MIEKDLKGNMVARVEPGVLRSEKTDYDPRISQIEGEVISSRSQVARADVLLRDLDSMSDEQLKSALRDLPDAGPQAQVLLSLEDLTRHLPDVRRQVMRQKGINSTMLARLEPELEDLKQKKDQELARRKQALEQLEAQSLRLEAQRLADLDADNRARDRLAAEQRVLEEKRQAALEEQRLKQKELRDAVTKKLESEEAQKKEDQFLKDVLRDPTPLLLAVLTPLQKKKLAALKAQNSYAVVKAEYFSKMKELMKVKAQIFDEEQELQYDQADAVSLVELRKRNKALSRYCAEQGMALEDAEAALNEAKAASAAEG